MSPETIYLKDYQPPSVLVPFVELEFDLDFNKTQVYSKLQLVPNPVHLAEKTVGRPKVPVCLYGIDLELLSLKLNGTPLRESDFKLEKGQLRFEISGPSELETIVTLYPNQNQSCAGVYVSDGIMVTQCEAEDFRRITFFPDKPDIMSKYRVTLKGKSEDFPLLLSNGNQISDEIQANGIRKVVYLDPWPKPCYLFALTAGSLGHSHEVYTTSSGRKVDCFVYASSHYLASCHFAMTALKKSMEFDENVYGLEYDLDAYHVVCVDNFNAGAMENKGLNIFNSKFVVASPQETSDGAFRGVRDVVGHEYFHNYSGNRVTCRDWFQLCLKEGLTVYREMQFSAYNDDPHLTRVAQVSQLFSAQFPEDAGPLAHPPRPPSFVKIDNFYTPTVYEKAAEIYRMMHLFLGDKGWYDGMSCYFKECDGKAVTVEEMIHSVGKGASADLTPFLNWFNQAGTPSLELEHHWNDVEQVWTLKITQIRPETPYGRGPNPVPVPLKLSLLRESDGAPQILNVKGCEALGQNSQEVTLKCLNDITVVEFQGIKDPVVPSVLRGFSAPLKINWLNSKPNWELFLALNDNDGVNRWLHFQDLFEKAYKEIYQELKASLPSTAEIPSKLALALKNIVQSPHLSNEYKGFCLEFPDFDQLASKWKNVDPNTLQEAEIALAKNILDHLESDLERIYNQLPCVLPYSFDLENVGIRSLRKGILSLYFKAKHPKCVAMAEQLLSWTDNITERSIAWKVLLCMKSNPNAKGWKEQSEEWSQLKQSIEHQSQSSAILRNQTIELLASVPNHHPTPFFQDILLHPHFEKNSPNSILALLKGFKNNWKALHHEKGDGYRCLLDETFRIDKHNSQLAARLLKGLYRVSFLLPTYQETFKKEVEKRDLSQISGVSREILGLIMAK